MTIQLGLALLASVTGAIAAYYWYCASKVKIEASWDTEPAGHAHDPNPGLPAYVAAAIVAFSQSASLNKLAALWTGISVLLSAGSALVGAS